MRLFWTTLSISTVLALSPGLTAPRAEDERPLIGTSFYPLTYMAERIGGARVRVVCPLPGESDPASWTPDRDAIQLYQAADMILLNGAGLEEWIHRVSLPRATRVVTSHGFKDAWLSIERFGTHSHGTSGAHSHRALNGYTWLDPIHAKAQAGAALDGIKNLLPDPEGQLDRNFDALCHDLDQLDQQFRSLGKLEAGTVLLASHPSFEYLAKRYGWSIVSLDLDPSGPLNQSELRQLEDELERSTARTLLWESAPPTGKQARIRERFGLASLVVSPCEHDPMTPESPSADYLSVMRANLERLRSAFPDAARD